MSDLTIKLSISKQCLSLLDSKKCLQNYSVNTAKNGVGELFGSECTPRGEHIIRAKIGAGAVLGAVFVGRRQTGEIYNEHLAESTADRDWILSRILWLSGKQRGFNRLGRVDTMRRYIYIHGAPDQEVLRTPASHGCVRMLNKDVIELFDKVSVGTKVLIEV